MNLKDPIFLGGDCQKLNFDHLPIQEGQIQQSNDPNNIETNLVAEFNDGHDNVANSSFYFGQSEQQFNDPTTFDSRIESNPNDSNFQFSLQMSYSTQDISDNNDNLVTTPILTSYPSSYTSSQSHQPFLSPLQTTFSHALSSNYNVIYRSNSNLSYGNGDGPVSINLDVGNLSFNFTCGTRNQARERDRNYQG
jgi:hypothetical protein